MAAIPVTYLELRSPPPELLLNVSAGNVSVARERLDIASYMPLWESVGAPWDWYGRKLMTPEAITKVLTSPDTDIYVLRVNGEPAGLCEFNRPDPPDTEIKYYGLIPAAQGRQLGPYLLNFALRGHWRTYAPRRIWLHTDTGDHVRAIATYEQAGFRTFAVHILDDTAHDRHYRTAIGLPVTD